MPSQSEQEPLVSSSHSSRPSLWEDAKDTIALAGPLFLAMLSWVGMKTTDSALLGHVSSDALAAAALSDLWTMCTNVFLQARVLGILCSAAVGAGNPQLAGIYLQVSYLCLGAFMIVVWVSWLFTEQVWLAFGSDAEISRMAGMYARILALSLIGQLAFQQLAQFFSAQRIMDPEVYSAAFGLVLNLILGLVFVLGIPIPGWEGFGFIACPIVTISVVYLQMIFLYLIFIRGKGLHSDAWPGWKPSEITKDRVCTFLKLYIPAALGQASDFWRVAVIGAVAAGLGEAQVAVFNTSYRLMWITMVGVNALSSASGIKTSQRLGLLDDKGAKQAGEIGIWLSLGLLVIVGVFVRSNIRICGHIFTNDTHFIDLLEKAGTPFTLTLVLMNLSVAIERIPYSMGRTREVFWLGFIASWGFQVPSVLILTYFWHDITGIFTGMAIGYAVLAALYGYLVFTSDWKVYAKQARERSEMPPAAVE